MTGKLRAGLWVQARIRQCDLEGIPAVVVRRGDPDAGAILIKIYRPETGCVVYTQFRDIDAKTTWVPATGEFPVDDRAADEFIVRQTARDRDLWVLEIEDHRGNFTLEGDQ